MRKTTRSTNRRKASKGSRASASRERARSAAVVRLSPEQEREYRKYSNATFTRRARAARLLAAAPAAPRHYTVVAEGDSWFDYKPAFLEGVPLIDPGRDLLGHLQAAGRFSVFRVSKAGDTMENMVYGTAAAGSGPTLRPVARNEIEDTLEAIRTKAPDAFLLSAGGNDVAGVELESYLNHALSGLPSLRDEVVAYELEQYVSATLSALIERVRAVNETLPIFLHGYDYSVPDGRGVVRLLDWTFVGPWLKPALVAKRIIDPAEGKGLVQTLVDRFNKTLEALAAAQPGVHYIDLRNTLSSGLDYRRDWANELHATSEGWKKLAQKLQRGMLAVLEQQ